MYTTRETKNLHPSKRSYSLYDTFMTSSSSVFLNEAPRNSRGQDRPKKIS
jgi:hypothetical protein